MAVAAYKLLDYAVGFRKEASAFMGLGSLRRSVRLDILNLVVARVIDCDVVRLTAR